MNGHDVSVVITCYNYARYLPRAIESVLAQTDPPLEIVIVNDGSTDDSDAVARGYLGRPGVRYIAQENGGQASAKNRGIRESNGPLVAFLDADDHWAPAKLERQAALFDDPEVGVVFSRLQAIDDADRPVDFTLVDPYLQPRSGPATSWLLYNNFIPFSSSIVRRECLDRVGLFDESLKMAIDWDLWLRVSMLYKFAYVDEPLLNYRIGHPGQMSKNSAERQACSDRITARFLDAHRGEISPGLVRRARAYSLRNRGYQLRRSDLRASTRLYWQSLRSWPFSVPAVRGMLKNAWLLCRPRGGSGPVTSRFEGFE